MHVEAETIEFERNSEMVYNGVAGTYLDNVVHMCS
jgi:hypothetical protein